MKSDTMKFLGFGAPNDTQKTYIVYELKKSIILEMTGEKWCEDMSDGFHNNL